MARIIVLASNKGGVGRTTSTVNIAAGLARGLGGDPKRVLLVDTDPQANATAVYLGPSAALGPAAKTTVYEVLVHDAPARNAIHTIELELNYKARIPAGQLDLLPSHIRLAKAEIELQAMFQRESRLKVALEPLHDDYDIILIDTSPSLALLTINGLVAAKELVIPVEPGYFPLIGIGLLMETVQNISRMNGLKLLGVLPTMQDRTVESRETLAALEQKFGDKMFTPIPRRMAARYAHASQTDVFGVVDKLEDAIGTAYANVVKEIVARG
ncbi:MAG: ParA family protein [Candidatus Promineifilaceae bacterium]